MMLNELFTALIDSFWAASWAAFFSEHVFLAHGEDENQCCQPSLTNTEERNKTRKQPEGKDLFK